MSMLREIEVPVDRRLSPEQEKFLLPLTVRLRSHAARVPNIFPEERSVLENTPMSVEEILFSRSDGGDLLGEMPEGRV